MCDFFKSEKEGEISLVETGRGGGGSRKLIIGMMQGNRK